MEPNYDAYTLDELHDVYHNIDRDKYPERFKKICEQIKVKQPLENKEVSETQVDKSDLPVREVDSNGNYVPNSISPTDRLWNILLAIGFTVYGGYGVYKDDLYIPFKSGEIHLSGESAWIMYAALICGCIYFLTIVVDHYDKRDNEIKYYMFGKNIKYVGLGLAIIAIFYPIFQS